MQPQEFRKAVTRSPFRPFTIHTAGGRAFRVDHPEFVMFPAGARTVVIWDRDERGYDMVDVMLVDSLEYRDERSADDAETDAA